MAETTDRKAYVHTFGKLEPSNGNIVIALCKSRDNAVIFSTRDQAERHKKEFDLNGFPFKSGDGSGFIFEAFEIEEGSENRFWIYGVGPFAEDTILP